MRTSLVSNLENSQTLVLKKIQQTAAVAIIHWMSVFPRQTLSQVSRC